MVQRGDSFVPALDFVIESWWTRKFLAEMPVTDIEGGSLPLFHAELIEIRKYHGWTYLRKDGGQVL